MTKMYLSVLCVVLLASQIEMAPVDPVTTLEVKHDAKTIDAEEIENVESIITEHLNNKLVHNSEETSVLSRLKRTILANTGYNKCSDGKVELWPGGICVICEEYMDLHDTVDCTVNP